LVEPKPDNEKGERVNIRVPINLIRAGLKWASFIPNHSQKKVGDALKEKGINVDLGTLTPDDLDGLIINLNDLQVDVDGDEVVKIFCE
jgi:predicted RNA-binding protein associated with RNAse of E/G family